ncbi:uncharacterized protein LOC127736607 [Mytilus californianus]|uniref:uncharacterized protein LOC127736607 n=1 Tax=Mytilus californianus TaxID=6549 RepID=UPI00224548ED|nr:uncharacterized protein LOC127736607 [Mytilus californianus]XP_052103126.1 uncharacterized protein LOC127736607 [Mytilus californianus]
MISAQEPQAENRKNPTHYSNCLTCLNRGADILGYYTLQIHSDKRLCLPVNLLQKMDVLLHWIVIYLFVNIKSSVISESLTWEREPCIMRIGEPVTLICTVHGVKTIDQNLTRQWSKGTESIVYNGHLDKPSEYKEILTAHNQFGLLIENLTESDLTSNYQCRYNFDTSSKKLQINAENFEYPPTFETTNIVYNTSSSGKIYISLHFVKVFPLPNCSLALENKYYQCKNSSIVKHSVYYEVFLNCEVNNCNTKPQIRCHLIEEYPIPWTTFQVCKENNHMLQTILISSIIPTGCLFVIIAIVIVICYKRKSKSARADVAEDTMLPTKTGEAKQS